MENQAARDPTESAQTPPSEQPDALAALRDAARAFDAFGRLAKVELALAVSLLARVLLAVLAALLLLPASIWFVLGGLLRLFEEWGLSPGGARLLLAALCISGFALLLRQARRWLEDAALPATRRQLRRLLTRTTP